MARSRSTSETPTPTKLKSACSLLQQARALQSFSDTRTALGRLLRDPWSANGRRSYKALIPLLMEDPDLMSMLPLLDRSIQAGDLIRSLRGTVACSRDFTNLANALYRLYNPLSERIDLGKDETENERGHYHYISFSPGEFIQLLAQTGADKVKGRFLDVGTGIMDKPLLAYTFGQFKQCFGLEYNPSLFGLSKVLLQKAGYQQFDPRRDPLVAMQGDAMTYEHYGEFDVIYMYRPIGSQQMQGVYQRVFEQAKPGAIIIEALRRAAMAKNEDGTIRSLPIEGTPNYHDFSEYRKMSPKRASTFWLL